MEARKSSRRRRLLIFTAAAFLYSALTVLVLQKIILPTWAAHILTVDGLLVGTDSVDFHQSAVAMAEQMKLHGWSAWEFRPSYGGTPIGLTAILYCYFSPHPWVLIPFNAALHAGAALWIVLIIESITGTLAGALASGVFYLIFPSALGWYGQIHRDGYFILGYLLLLSCWLRLSKIEKCQTTPGQIFLPSLGEAMVGVGLIWLARPYARTLLLFLSIPVVLALFVYALRSVRPFGFKNILPGALTCLVVLAFLGKAAPTYDSYQHEISESEAISLGLQPELNADKWESSRYLPASVDFRLKQMALARSASKRKYSPEASFIDNSIRFENAWQIFCYLPRALQIGFLAPFPDRWFVRGSTPAGTLFRAISAVEMLTIYFAFLYVVLNLASLVFNRRFLILAWFGTGLILFNAIVINNVGSLYRIRYGYIMSIAAVGVALAYRHWDDVIQQLKFELGSSSRDVTSA